jgi:adenylate cyclase
VGIREVRSARNESCALNAGTAGALQYRWTWDLRVTPEALWPRIADTDRFNRDAELPTIEGETPGFCTVQNGCRRLRLRQFGVTLEWYEEPFEWVRPHRFSVVRRYISGPIREMHVDVRLEPTALGTRLHYNVDVWPRNAATRPFVRLASVVTKVRFRRLFEEYASRAAKDPSPRAQSIPLPMLMRNSAALQPGAEQRLERGSVLMREVVHPDIVERIIELVRFGDDGTVLRMRPYALADIWNLPRPGVLRALLHATRAGLLTLQWDVVCPLCRGAKSTSNTLSELQAHVYCECCHANIDTTEFERSVELTFRPSPAIRALDVESYCVGGPIVTPHIALQQLLAASSSRTVPLRIEPGEYRLRSFDRDGGQTVQVHVEEPPASTLVVPAGEWPQDDAHIGRRTLLTITNAGDSSELVILERRAWADDAVTAAAAFRLQDFRDLFARETLRAGQHLSVGSVAVLFTDVRGSTRMYRDIGDAVAFARIREHFDVLRAAVVLENGVVVKTIGDSVMAVFQTPAAAVRAVLRAAEVLGSAPEGVQPVQLKAGLHYGPCIAVTLNDTLDYFGSTVNIAARLGELADGGDIVISDEAFRDGEIAGVTAALTLESVSFDALLKGIDDAPVRVWRLTGSTRYGRC